MNKITTLCQAVASISYFSSRMNRSSQLGKRTSLPLTFTLVLTFLLSLVRVGDVWGQVTTTLINPLTDGGFELGSSASANGWTTTTGSATQNQWVVNTGSFYAGTRSAYITNNTAGAPPPNAYTNSATRVSHIYKDFSIPSGSSSATLSFYWKGVAESCCDYLRVIIAPNNVTPVYGTQLTLSGAAPSGTLNASNFTTTYTNYNNSSSYQLVNINIPSSYFNGNTYRVIFQWRNDSSGGSNPPASLDNVSLTYVTPPPCSGTPSPGNTISSSAAVAPGSTVDLSLQNATVGTGVSYQWQSSTTSATAGFSNITGATSSTYTATVNAATWYRCIVTCSGNSGTSTATQVTLTYCTPSSSSVDGTGITNVTFGVGPVVNNTTAAETNNYGDYSSQIGAVYIGNTVSISMTFNTSTYAYTTGIYVDWNQDLDFNDAGETVWTGISGTSSPNTLNATFTLPGSAVAGQNYRMRIGGDDSGVVPAACATGLTYACFEDYTLSVITCTPPTTQASAITFGSITSTSSNVNWTNGNGGGRVVYINTTNSFTAPSDGTNPTATTAWANTGQQCIFNGTGSGPVTVTGLSASTTYWVRVYEYCTPNRNYQTATATGNSNSFTTAAPTPTISASSVAAFGNYCINGTTTPNSFTVSAAYLSPANASLTISSPVGFGISTSSTGPFSSNLTLTASSGSVSSTLIYVVFQPTAIQSYSGNISITGGGATAQNIPVSGSGVSSLTYTGATNTISAANSSICLGSSATLTSSVSSPGVVTMNSSSSLSSSTSYPTAFENYWYQSWQQFLYTASELQALGLTAGNITSLSFNVNTVPNPNTTITDYNIKVGSTTNGSISTFTTGGLTNVFGPTAITATSGWNTITFATPYNWDGVSNIIIDLRQTGFYGNGNAVTVCNTTASSSVVYAYSSSNNATFWSSGPTVTTSTLRPNIKFGGQVNAGPTAYSWSNGSSIVGTTNPLVQSLTTATSFTCTATVSGCPIVSNTLGISVNPLPTISANAVNNTICLGTNTGLSATGGSTYTWSPSTNLSSSNGATTTFTPSSSGNNQIFTVTGTDANGCSNTAQVAINVLDVPASVSVLGLTPSCNSTTLTASGGTGGSIYYQGTTSNGTSTATLSSSQTVSSSGTYYFRAYNGTCFGPQGSATVVINTQPVITLQPSTNSVTKCHNTQSFAALSITATGTNLTYQWYSNTTASTSGGSLIAGATSASYTPSNATVGTLYYYCIVSSASCPSTTSGVSGAMEVIGSPTSPVVSAASTTINVGGSAIVTGTLGTTGNTLAWYSVATGGTPIALNNTPVDETIFNTANIPLNFCTPGTTTTYYLEETNVNNGCPSVRTPFTITTNPISTSSPANLLICQTGGSVTMTANVVPSSGTPLIWESSSNGSTFATLTPQPTTPSILTVSPSATTHYQLAAITPMGCSNSITFPTFQVGVLNPLNFTPTATPSEVCVGETSALVSNTPSGTFSVASIPFAPATLPSSQSVNNIPAPPVGTYTTLSIGGAATTPLTGGNLDDGGWGGIPIGFDYNFFGSIFSSLGVGTNGLVMFGPIPGYGTGAGQLGQFNFNTIPTVFPNTGNPGNVIGLMLSDMRFSTANGGNGILRYWNDGIAPTRRFILSGTYPQWSGGALTTVQLILYETSGIVEVHITSSAATIGRTVGLQDATKTIGALAPGWNNRTTTLTTPEAWRFTPPANYTFQWSTAGQAIAGETQPTYTTPTLANAGAFTYNVAAFNPTTNCTTTQSVNITVNPLPAAPNSGGNVTACSNATSTTLSATAPTGCTIDWYTNAQGTGAPVASSSPNYTFTPSSTPGTYNYYAFSRNTTTNCESLTGTLVVLTVNQAPSAPTVNPSSFTYCQGISATTLSATPTGSNTMTWYTGAVSGTGSSTAPTPSTATAGTTTYNVTQTDANNACVSPAASITVTVNATPSAPAYSGTYSTGTITQCQGTANISIGAAVTASAGGTLNYYTVPTGGSPLGSVPSTNGAVAATVVYYVSQTILGCEGPRVAVTSVVNPSLTPAVAISASTTTTCPGTAINFTAIPTNGGPAPTYQWYLNGVAVGGQTASTYTLASPVNTDAIYVSMNAVQSGCFFTFLANSSTITLSNSTVSPSVSIIQSTGTTICAGTSVTYSVQSSVNMGATPTYAWKVNGTTVGTGSTYTTAALANNDVVTLSMTSSLNAACLSGSATSNSAGITMTVTPATTITAQPANASVCLGGSQALSVSAVGTGTITYQWQSSTTPSGTFSNISFASNSSAQSATLSLPSVSGQLSYQLVATSTCGTATSNVATVSINQATVINTQPQTQTVCQGSPVTFSVGALGTGTISYQWRYNGAPITGATNASYIIPTLALSNAGTYSVVVTATCGSVTSANAQLTVTPLTSISVQPTGSTVCAGSPVNLSVSAAGTGTLTYQWMLNGSNVSGATSAIYTIPTSLVSQSGSYTVVVTGGCSSLTSSAAAVVVNTVTAINTQPLSYTGCAFTPTSITVGAVGTNLTYAWSNSGTAVNNATSATYTMSNPQPVNSGSYTVTVSGTCGVETSNIALITINPLPSPGVIAGGTNGVCVGATTTLTNNVSGGVWTSNNTTIATVNSSTGVVTGVAAGNVTITYTVTNAFGCVNTTTTTIQVKAVPTAVILPPPATQFCIGESMNLQASNAFSYLWSNGATTQTTTVSTSGNYTVTVTGNNGCVATSAPLTITVTPAPTVAAIQGSSNLCVGSSYNFTSATANGLWSSSNTSVLNVNTTSGLVTPTAAGTATITYNVANIPGCLNTTPGSASTTVTINTPPVAQITSGGATTFCQGGSVSLSANSGASYLWSNGATTQTISATSSGSYTVTVTNASGCSTTSLPVAVTVNALPNANILPGANVNVCAGSSVMLSTGSAAAYSWSNGATTPTISVNAAGTYTVTLTGSNGCTATSAPTTVSVVSLPAAQITASGATSICQGSTVSLTASTGTGYSYLWSNGATTQTIAVGASGAYSVSVTNNGCTSTSQATSVNVVPVPSAQITASGPLTFCDGGSVSLNAPSGNGYTYVWSNGSISQQVSTAISGTFSVVVSNSFGCTASSTPVSVTVNPLPAISALSGPSTICMGSQASLSHAVSGGIYSISNTAVAAIGQTSGAITPVAPGTALVTYTYSNAFGCSNSVQTNITVNPTPTASATPSGATTFCQGGSVAISAPAALQTTYLWSNGSTQQNITATTSGAYNVVMTNSFGCSATSNTVNVTVNALPNTTVYPGAAVTICSGTTVTLSTSTAAAYQWSTGANTPTITVSNAGSYSATLTGSNGCTATTAPIVVTVNQTPLAQISSSGSTAICQGNSVTLTANSGAGYTYLWNTGATTPSISASSSGAYSVVVTNNGCSATSSATNITINPVPSAAITASGPLSFCDGGSVTLTAPAGNNYTYSWSNGATTQSVSTAQSASFTLTVSNAFGCSSTSTPAVVTVNPLPAQTPLIGSTTVCQGTAPIISHAISGGIFSTSNSTVLNVSTLSGTLTPGVTGSAVITYVYSNAFGCSNSVSQTFTVAPSPSAAIAQQGATTFCQGGSVTLLANAGTSYLWSNGATTQSISATTSGAYTVVISNSFGCSSTSNSIQVNVNPAPNATLYPGASVNICDGSSVTLSTGTAAAYLWSNGSTSPTITVNQAGSYSVTLTGSNGCTSTSAVGVVTVTPVPVASITASGPITICQGSSVTLTAAPATSYLWNNGATTQSITVSTVGSYFVNVGTGSCSATSAPVFVSYNPVPQAAITASGPTTFCVGGQVTLNATSGNGYTYLWSNGATTPSITSSTAGTFAVTVTNAFGCSATSSNQAVAVNPLPTVTPITGASSLCANGQIQLANAMTGGIYTSSNLNAATIGNTSGVVSGVAAGTTTISYLYTDNNGCSNTVTYPISVLAAPLATISNSGATSFCQGGSVTLTAASAASYLWSTGATTASIIASTAGSYSVTLTAANGCSATSAATAVTVNALPTVSILQGSAVSYCAGGAAQLSASPAASYLWSNGANTQTINVNAPGNYSVQVTSTNGCVATSIPTTVTQLALPTALITASGPTTICQGNTVVLTASPASSYAWSNGATTQSITVLNAGSYTVQTSNGSCSASSAPVVVAFNPVPQAVVTASGPTTFCAGGQVTLSAPSGNGFTYLWSNGASTPTITSTAAGNYSVTVTNANGCSATSSPVAVTVNALPVVPAITGATSVCSNAQIQLSNTSTGGVYSSSNASVATIGNLSGLVTGQTPGTTTISYQVSNSNGCSNTVTYPITVLAAPTAAMSNSGATSFCQGGSVTLTAGAASAYLWNTGQTTQAITVSNTGNYAVTITAANGCSATTLPTSVAVLSLPTVNAIAGSNTVCSNGITTLTNSTSNGLWSSSNTAVATVNTSTGIVAGVTPGSVNILYTVVGTNGCSATALKPMTVISPTAATVTAAGATTICQGSTVTLTASAASSYLWSNGATTQSITVAQSGPYNVQTTINGCTATSSNTVVTVVNPPVASISANGLTALCTGGSVTLTAAPASTYAWSTGATTQSITVSAAGSYTVSVSSGGCSATSAPTVVTLNATPSATISASGATSFCQGGSVTLSAPAATSYLWSNGANTQSITVSAAGSYSVSVSSNGCSATSSATAVSILPSPTAVITNTGSTTFCAGGSVVLNGPTAPTGSTFTYVWRLNGTPITGATAVNYTANTAGAYSLVVTNNQGCSTTSGNTTVVVNALPTATITPSGSTTICAGSSLTLTAPAGAAYVWSNGASTQSISVTSAGSYTVTVNANGCTATSTPTVVTVNALPTATITAAGSTTLCQGSSVVLTASPATSYLWSTGATSASITVANAGNYSVALTTNGCSATSAVTTVNVTPLPTPSVSVIGATTFCQGGSVTLTASIAGAYLWSNGATTQTIVVNTPGNYTVQATTNGCAATTAAIPVVVNALPTAGITAAGPTTFCQGGSVVLTAAAASSYLWSNGATTQSITVNTSGNYTVQATNANGCSASSAATAVSVQAPPAQPQIVVNGALALCPGSSVTLSAPTAASYLWTNGATTQSIVVSTPGNIGLTVGTAAGCTASAAPVSITALSAPTASITASGSTTLCAGSSVVLTAAPATSYLWSNGATTQSISVQSAGSYTVQATSNGCSATSLPTVVQVNALPVASITASGPLTFCQGGSVTLSAAPATSYLWSNGATTQSITVQNAGTYDVGLTQNGCFAQSAPTQVVVQALPSVNVSASGPLTFCEGSSVTLTADPANTYAWSNGATTQSITVSNSATLTLTSSNGVCSASSNPLNIQVLAAPALSANAGPNAVCVGSTIQLSNATLGGAWSAQNASVATVNAATGEVSALSSGLTNMTYTVVYPNGCSVAATSAISVNTIAPVSIVANGPLSFCNGSSVQLSLPAGFAYQWSTNQVGQNIVVNTAGTYSATVTNAAGCSVQVAPVQVTVFSSPALAIQASTPAICSGQSVNLTANLPAASYSWSNGSQNSSITVQQPGNYALSIIDANGCSASALYTLGTGITPNASVTAAGATNFCAGSNVTLNANNYAGGTYLWSTGATTQSITANTTGSYFVTITSPSGCSAVSNAVVVNVLTAPAASITVTGATTSCSNQSVSLAVSATGTYLWTNNAISQSITPTASGNYGVTVTGANGCTTVVPPVAITILPAPVAQITASGPTTFCEGGSVNLLASGANTYVWNGNQTGAQISATTSGAYLVTATAANGCTDTEQIQVTVNPLPADFIVASGPLSFCEGESVVLSAAPGNTYLWSNGAQTSSVVIAASGTYDAVLTSPAGCVSNTNSLTVQVNQATSSTINATGGNDYLLNGILYTQSGTYTQVLTNAAGCDSTITLNLTLTVGVGENSALSFSVQPNPTDAIFTLKASEALFSNYVIQDAQGKVVAIGALTGTSTTINIDQVARGIYFLKVAEAAEAIRIVKN